MPDYRAGVGRVYLCATDGAVFSNAKGLRVPSQHKLSTCACACVKKHGQNELARYYSSRRCAQ